MKYNHLLTQPYFDEKEVEMVSRCLESKWVTQGPMTEKFEELFKQHHGGKYAVAVSNCTTGLHMAMLAIGIERGDEVLVPAYTWITSANCIEYVGARAVFVDVNDSFNIDPEKIEQSITERTKAIVVVHEFGCAAEMDAIMDIACRHNLSIIEDCACAIGTKYKGKPVGTFGEVGVFSFHPRKVITTGEGGMCITDDPQIAQKLDTLRNHGLYTNKDDEAYGAPFYMGEYNVLGFNFRLSDIQAAVGIAQMDKLDTLLKHRRECAHRYIDMLSDVRIIKTPEAGSDYGSTFQSFVVLLPQGSQDLRNKIMKKLQESGIQTKQGTHAVHRLGYYKNRYEIGEMDFPMASYCEDCSITLPIYPSMTEENQNEIVKRLIDLI